MLPDYHTEFLTSTILKWQHLLQDDYCKQMVVDSLAWLTEQQRCTVYGFVIMPNHIHLLWRIGGGFVRREVQTALLSFTAHRFKAYLQDHPSELRKFYAGEKDRLYQFWEQDSMVKECWSDAFFEQKLNYVHNNPCQPHWRLCRTPEEYPWSSAAFYYTGKKNFPFLHHYRG